MMTESARAILVKLDRHFRTDEIQSRSFQHHLAGVFPAAGRDVDSVQRLAGDATYPAMDVRKVAAVNPVEDPIGEWCAEVTVQFRHRTFLDAASKTAAHDELRSFAKFLYEGTNLAEVIRQIGVAHQYPFSPNVRNRVDVCAADSPSGNAEDLTTIFEHDVWRVIG